MSTMTDEDLTILEDLAPACQYRSHDERSTAPAEWIIWCLPHPCLKDNPRLFCEPCRARLVNAVLIVCSKCGAYCRPSEGIVRIEAL